LYQNNFYCTFNKINRSLSFNYKSPEAAFKAIQKALSMLSENVNVGIESVSYINEFQNSKELIFKTK